tara:strand:+ start:187 stop:582 length:396 start_codon:yes stop_codon:yes gene_type:complete
MATTTAQVKLTSADLASDSLSIDVTSTLTDAGVTTGITDSTGIAVKKLVSNSTTYTIHDAADSTDNKAAKAFIYNKSTTATDYITVDLGTVAMGRLYAGDWAFFPYAGLVDITVQGSANNMMVEYAVLGDL